MGYTVFVTLNWAGHEFKPNNNKKSAHAVFCELVKKKTSKEMF